MQHDPDRQAGREAGGQRRNASARPRAGARAAGALIAGVAVTSIDAELPREIGAGGLSRFAAYQRFPVYTWPWFLRRAVVFCPFAVAYGLFMAVWHASSMTTWADAAPMSLRTVPAGLIIIGIAPALASMIRYLRLPPVVEAVCVVLALLLGLAAADAAGRWAADYHAMLMGRHGGRRMPTPEAVQSLSHTLARLMGRAPRWIGLFLVGGGLDLPSYLTERRRLAEHQRRRDLSRARQDKAEADLKLAVLQAQIEPHFLFNTLASVRSLIRSEPERAAKTVDALAEYLRSTLPRLREDVGLESASLGQQLDICVRYLELMNIRMGERLSVTVEAEPALRALAFPPLLLISLVENAVKHGVETKAGPAHIALRARQAGGALEVAVEDDGVGLQPGAGAGVGLANIRAQLAHRFGAEASLVVESRPAGGVRAAIVLPAAQP